MTEGRELVRNRDDHAVRIEHAFRPAHELVEVHRANLRGHANGILAPFIEHAGQSRRRLHLGDRIADAEAQPRVAVEGESHAPVPRFRSKRFQSSARSRGSHTEMTAGLPPRTCSSPRLSAGPTSAGSRTFSP